VGIGQIITKGLPTGSFPPCGFLSLPVPDLRVGFALTVSLFFLSRGLVGRGRDVRDG
jgi:hypothetical protein